MQHNSSSHWNFQISLLWTGLIFSFSLSNSLNYNWHEKPNSSAFHQRLLCWHILSLFSLHAIFRNPFEALHFYYWSRTRWNIWIDQMKDGKYWLYFRSWNFVNCFTLLRYKLYILTEWLGIIFRSLYISHWFKGKWLALDFVWVGFGVILLVTKIFYMIHVIIARTLCQGRIILLKKEGAAGEIPNLWESVINFFYKVKGMKNVRRMMYICSVMLRVCDSIMLVILTFWFYLDGFWPIFHIMIDLLSLVDFHELNLIFVTLQAETTT